MNVVGIIYSESFLPDNPNRDWSLNSVIDIENDELGNLPADKFFPGNFFLHGKEIILFEKYKIKDLFDALLYVGEIATLKRCPMPEPDFDDEYWDELNRRRKIVGMQLIPKP